MNKSKLLSQKEIDALMTQAASHEVPESYERSQEVNVYDFRHPNRVSKEQMRTLRTINDRFARTFGTYLSNTLRTMVDVKVNTIDQVTYSEYTLSVSVPSSLFIFNMTKLGGSSIFEVPPNLFFFLIDRLLGGAGKVVDSHREVTTIEQKVMEKIIIRGLKDLDEAWEDVTSLKPELSSFETNPQFVQIAPASETVIVILFDVIIGERTYSLNLCIPFIALEKVMSKLNIHSYIALTQKQQTPEIRRDIEYNLNNTHLPVRVELGKVDITIKDFINLEVGDVLTTDSKITNELPIIISGKQKFWAKPGIQEKSKAVRITRKSRMDDPDDTGHEQPEQQQVKESSHG
ncbi:MAG: flagellar motor switch protein FliM [Candidatus Marinimicrobia bacterium]|nr:flagellar motor switch protein FliM [Candidatus Neomarinimicrobiota bacterium]MCF7880510.1 flagellar motor switch protein FliM [Candidatus Neomarinimicrobiota bacterium]